MWRLIFVLLAVPAVAGAQTIADIGLVGSESARFDSAGDRWIVANSGQRGKDAPANDGFLSLIGPDGRVETLKWVAGGQNGAILNDPFGIAIVGDIVHVADNDAVRRFDRRSGKPLGDIAVPGAIRLNDIAAAPDGTLYVTDSGSDAAPGALYRISKGRVSVFVARDPALERPNGIAVLPDGNVVHGGRGVNLVVRSPKGRILREITLPTGRIDGIVALASGAMLVASQDGHVVYSVAADGTTAVVAKDIPIPAAIGLDAGRQRMVVPQLNAGTLTLVDLAP